MEWFIRASVIQCLQDYRELLQKMGKYEEQKIVGYLISRLLELNKSI